MLLCSIYFESVYSCIYGNPFLHDDRAKKKCTTPKRLLNHTPRNLNHTPTNPFSNQKHSVSTARITAPTPPQGSCLFMNCYTIVEHMTRVTIAPIVTWTCA